MASPVKQFKSSSQSSKVTSSPKTSSQFMSSPDISSIASGTPGNNSIKIISRDGSSYEIRTNENSSKQSSSEQFEESMFSESQITVVSKSLSQSVSELDENFEEYFKSNHHVVRKGPVWKLYKPDDEDSTLYSKMLKEPYDLKNVATELMLQYISGSGEKVTKELIEFCVQLAGFRNFEVDKYYSVHNYKADSKTLMIKLEMDVTEQPVLMEYGRYLLMERETILLKNIKMGLYTFLRSLVNVSHEMDVLYDDHFMRSFVTFIKCMGDSKLKCVRHTGVILVIKLLTGIVMLLNNFIKNQNCQEAEYTRRKTILESIISSLYLIVYQNCRLPDKSLSSMRLECIQESRIWITYFPNMFGNHLQFFDVLTKLLSDEAKEVRLAALEIYVRFLMTPNIVEFLKYHTKKIIKNIVGRFDDNVEDIRVRAIGVFKYFAQKFPEHVTENIIEKIKDLVFDQSAVVGKAAGECLLFFIRRLTESNTNVLVTIASILNNKKNRYCKEFLVESFLDSCSEIRDWKLFCECFLKKDIENAELFMIGEIFAESVKQVLNGRPTILRTMSSKTSKAVEPMEHQRVSDIFDSLRKIMQEFSDDPKIMVNMVKILNQIDYKHLKRDFEMDLLYMAEIIVATFERYTYKPLLIQTTIFFDVMCNIPGFQEQGNVIAQAVCANQRQYLFDLLIDPEADDNASIFKVVLLYKYFDFNEDGLLTFNDLIKSLEDHSLQSVSHLLMVIKWNLIWTIKAIIGNIGKYRLDLSSDLKTLSNTSKEYLSVCVQNITQSNDKKLTVEMFINMREFIVMFTKKLNDAILKNRIFNHLKLKIRDENLQKKLGVVLRDIIIDENISLVDRRKLVNGYIEMVNCGIIIPESLVNVYRYFNSHNYEFGSIIENSLNIITQYHDTNIIFFTILYSLFHIYDEIKANYGVVDIKSKQGIELNLLAKRFSTFKFLHDRLNLLKLLCLAIQNTLRDQTKLNLLFFLKHFVDLLSSAEDKEYILNIFQKNVKDEHKRNDAILYFAMLLKPKNKPPVANPFPGEQIKRKKVANNRDRRTPKKRVITNKQNKPNQKTSSNEPNSIANIRKNKAAVFSDSQSGYASSSSTGTLKPGESSNSIQTDNQLSPKKASSHSSHSNSKNQSMSSNMSEAREKSSDFESSIGSVTPKSK